MGSRKRRIVILAEGYFGELEAKTASALIRYKPEEVVAVIDSSKQGKSSEEILGYGGKIPVVKDIFSSLAYEPNDLLIGIAPRGGKLPSAWRAQVVGALENGLNIINGLHDLLGDDPELAALAELKKVKIWDLRRADQYNKVADFITKKIKAKVVLTVGSDCKTGKMITAIEVAKQAEKEGWRSFFIATGQTGIVIAGCGIPIDSIKGDFMAGAIEDFILQKSPSHDLLLVEGQGTLIHPGYSGVSLALLHGSAPDALILCHYPRRKKVINYDIPIPPLSELVKLHEEICKHLKPSKVVGIALNTEKLSQREAEEEIEKAEAETGLPAVDPIRFGSSKLVKALEFLKQN